MVTQTLRLAVIPSLRLETAKDTLTSPARYRLSGVDTQPATYWLPNARLALVQWASEQVTLRANLGRYGRLPSLTERYGNTGLLLGTPNLVPESGTNADVGANWTRQGERLRLSLDGALFAVWARNLIHFLMAGPYWRPENVGLARILGAETSATVDWRRRFRFFGQTTFTDAATRKTSAEVMASSFLFGHACAPTHGRSCATFPWRVAGAGGCTPTWT